MSIAIPCRSSHAWRSLRNAGGLAVRSGSAAASCANESTSERDDPHDHQRADQDDRDDHGDHGDPSRESGQAPLEDVGDRGDEERQQPGEEEDEDQPEVVLEVPREEPEDHEGDGDGREDDKHLDPSGPTLQHVSQSACRPAAGVDCFHIGCTVRVHLALPIPIPTATNRRRCDERFREDRDRHPAEVGDATFLG